MHTVICCLNSKYIHSSLAPWCLLAGVRAYSQYAGTVQVVEGTVNEPMSAVLERITENAPQVIGFCTYIWNVTEVLALSKALKQQNHAVRIVLGGPEVSYRAKDVLENYPFIDFVLSGEGEKPFAQFLDALTKQSDLSAVGGLCYRTGDTFHISEPYLPTEEPVSPYVAEYLQTLRGRIAYLETSRGCPYSCAFCLSGRCGTVRFFDLERAKENLLLLANSGAQTVKLVDRTFNADKRRAYALFSFIIENYGGKIPNGVCFHFEIAGDILDDCLIEVLRTAPAGTIQLEIGLQSFNETTLAAVNRKTDTNRLIENIKKLIAPRNIHIHIDLIAGLPHEDAESFADSFNRAFALQPDMLQFGFLKLLYGAPMRENPTEYPCVFSETPPYEVQSTPWLTAEELAQMHRTEDAFDRTYNSGRFRRTADFALQACGISPFAFFSRFADWLSETNRQTQRTPLDMYSEYLFLFLTEHLHLDAAAVRDKMVCDRLATNASGVLTRFLQRQDARLKGIRTALQVNPNTKTQKGVKRAVAILYTENRAVYADYTVPNPVTGAYTLHFIPFNEN